jgi:hypothetical protein
MDFIELYQTGGNGFATTREVNSFLTALNSIEIAKPASFLLYKKTLTDTIPTRPPSPSKVDSIITVEAFPATTPTTTTTTSMSMSENSRKQVKLAKKKSVESAATSSYTTSTAHFGPRQTSFHPITITNSKPESSAISAGPSTEENPVAPIIVMAGAPDVPIVSQDKEEEAVGFVREGINGLNVKPCKCKRSRCLKMYCDCFAAQLYCTGQCTCQDCYNTDLPWHAAARKEVIDSIIEKNPNAFENKVQVIEHRGCHCKRSNCLKKYCECYAVGLHCTDICKCVACLNRPGAVIPEGLYLPTPTPRGLGAAGIAAVEASNSKILFAPTQAFDNITRDTSSPSNSYKRMKTETVREHV